MHHHPDPDEGLITRLVAAVVRELNGRKPPAQPVDPHLRISDADARKQLYGGLSRSAYWALTKEPDFPSAVMIGRTKLRLVRDHLEFLARRSVR